MHRKAKSHNSIFGIAWNSVLALMVVLLVLIVVVLFIVFTAQPAQAQTFQVIHNFTGGMDGANPQSGLTMDAAGNLYGTTYRGGTGHLGGVFKIKHSGPGWIVVPLYSFAGGNDGANPWGRVAIARDGTLYGTTYGGGEGNCVAGGYGCGMVFHLTPPATVPRTALSPWSETVLYRFTGGNDGGTPQGDLTLDTSGNIYGTTEKGGFNDSCCGVIYELKPFGGSWTESVLYVAGQNDSYILPNGGVIFDHSGNLYGVFTDSSNYSGGVYQLLPSGSSWTEQIVYGFTGGSDGGKPFGGLIIDSSGNLYGTTLVGGNGGGGTVFELTPTNGGWSFNTLYGLQGSGCCYPGSWDKLAMDAAGNLYGTTQNDGAYGVGSVFKLTSSNGGWIYTSLHDFTGGSDGKYPISNLVLDANGNLYGTAGFGGTYNSGVVFEITP